MRDDFGVEKSYLGRAALDGGFAIAITSGGHGVFGVECSEGWMDRS